MVKLYLESREGKLYEITIDEFIRNNKKFAGGKMSKSEAISHLKSNFEFINDFDFDNFTSNSIELFFNIKVLFLYFFIKL